MSLPLFFLGFWSSFNVQDNFLTKLLSQHNVPFNVVNHIDQCKLLVVAPFLAPQQMPEMKRCTAPRICFVTEPVMFYGFLFDLIEQGYFRHILGCVAHDPVGRSVKLPLYAWEPLHLLENASSDNFQNRNRFCTLVNRHDMGHTRTAMYEALSELGQVDCPSKLLNNLDNAEINRAGGLIPFLRHYQFNLCPENCEVSRLPGYITEKLFNACAAGCIPIFLGHFDDIDGLVFNRHRILFYQKTPQSIAAVRNRVHHLLTHPDELATFAAQPIFLPGAKNTILTMHQHVADCFRKFVTN